MGNYEPQQRHLAKMSRIQVWIDREKYAAFQAAVKENGDTIYALVHGWIDEYMENEKRRPK